MTGERIAVEIRDPARDLDLEQLAVRCGLARLVASRAEASVDLVLRRDDRGLLLNARLPGGMSIVRAAMLAPRASVGRHSSLLARAVGGAREDLVVDATCGLGRDALELAALGYRVQAYERHPVLAFLLRDALATTAPIELHEADAIDALATRPAHSVHAVCLDPMFPARSKSARVKKEAEVLRILVPREPDLDALFAVAWRTARRVVVKRPRHAAALREPVDFTVAGRALRFDVYLTQGRPLPPA
ncbi:MAG: class I SAM-dependent methyltransferase [Planctomycetota bacterium]